ncbi:uncharacterized protein LOC132044396 [Lycium ferocissimum]|uniref:uncharacterized protein LOC132044396 n=1 Tax=Lycium ferocissimum TaxID=112874 RepID=UPI0028156100|nr:uncharacterized protein LOC132044396 [Lycium ferocissimum]
MEVQTPDNKPTDQQELNRTDVIPNSESLDEVQTEERPTQVFSHGSAEPEVSSHVTVEPQDSAPVDPQEQSTQAFSHGPAEPEVSSHEIIEPQVRFLLKINFIQYKVHPSAPAVATLDEDEVAFPDPAQPEILSVLAGLDPKKKHVMQKGTRARDDHGLEGHLIKRKKGDGDDGEGGGDGMSLRPKNSLRHTICGTH